MNYTTQEFLNYITNDRQWKREHRIAHAQYQLGKAKKDKNHDETNFWQHVLDANGE